MMLHPNKNVINRKNVIKNPAKMHRPKKPNHKNPTPSLTSTWSRYVSKVIFPMAVNNARWRFRKNGLWIVRKGRCVCAREDTRFV